MAIDQERARQWRRKQGWPVLNHSRQTGDKWETILTDELLAAYAAEERRAERKRCAEIARKWPYSDIYAKEHIAAAIEQGRVDV